MSSKRTHRQYVALLALVSGAILIFGSLLKPKKTPETPISQAELVSLQTLTQRRNLEDMASFFSDIANGVKSGLVWLEGMGAGGVVWEGNGLIISPGPRDLTTPTVSALTPEGEIALQTDVLSPEFPVARLRAPGESGLRPVFRTSVALLQQGAWILQVTSQQDGSHLFARGIYGGIGSARCGEFDVETVETSLPLTEAALGGGLFDMDGNLLGVLLRCGDRVSAVTPEGVDAILAEANTFGGQLARRYGLRVEALTDETRRYFEAETGVLVTRIFRGMPADAAGLVPGDVIQALDDNPINTVDDLARLVLPVAYPTFHLYVKRGRRSLRLDLMASESDIPSTVTEAAGQGIRLGSAAEGYLIENVIPGSRAERASLKTGDRLLEVGGRQYGDLEAVRKILSDTSQETVFIVVQRGERKLGVFLR